MRDGGTADSDGDGSGWEGSGSRFGETTLFLDLGRSWSRLWIVGWLLLFGSFYRCFSFGKEKKARWELGDPLLTLCRFLRGRSLVRP